MEPIKILLAEDDRDDQELFRHYLQQREDMALMHIAENGIELIDYLETIDHQHHLPHLIVLDQNMPKQNGVQTLQALKNSDKYRHIPTILYSTYKDQWLVDAGKKLGASKVLQKPSSTEGYLKMMSVLVDVLV
jgi:CheY-like chemotaxis protein